MRKVVLVAILGMLAAGLPAAQVQPLYDVVIADGRVVDGAGNPWYVADIGIRSGRIEAIGRVDRTGAKVIDARGLVVAPGFIDVHTHAEDGVRRQPTADNYIHDGVTTIVAGNCGSSDSDIGKLFDELRADGMSVNFATMIGHNTVRRAVLGTEDRHPSAEELATMESLVERAMRDGAVGFSTGLIYVPGTYADTPEVLALARVAGRLGGLYASHIRDEGSRIEEAIEEAIHIGREAGMPVQIAHFKVSGKTNWGRSTRTIELVQRARAAGVDVTVDQYPYAASSTSLGSRLPTWALAGGQERLLERLADPATRRRIAGEMEQAQKRDKRKNLDYMVVASCRWDRSLEGRSITDITRSQGRKRGLRSDIETVLEIVEKGGAQMVYHQMDERDVERIMRYPYTMIASDSGVVELGQGVPHPRAYGTNARVLGRYVRERQIIGLEEAIRKMTSFPAQRFGFADRGLIRPGMHADLVVFDPAVVTDRATYEKPHAYSEGFRFVLVNGEVVAEDGKHTGRRPGQILYGPAR
jgi:N-acyl-D-amino-acid deacylase